MAWLDEAKKHTAEPVAVVEIDFTDAGKKKYSVDYIRPANTPAYKGNILKLPYLSNSIGDLVRTFIDSRIDIVFADTDREFRNLIMTEGIKNREVKIKLLFINTTVAGGLTIFTGNIYNWNPLANMRFEITCEQKSRNLKNKYPNKVVTSAATDYPDADEWGLGKLIPVPYGTISSVGLCDDGAFPCILVDPTLNFEIHLVGRQEEHIPIEVLNVYIDGTRKDLGGLPAHYTILTRNIDSKMHTEIHWNNGVNPTFANVVTCDIRFGTRTPCEAWRHFLIEFCDHVAGDFDNVSYGAAQAIEVIRGYKLDGAFVMDKELIAHENQIRDEFELDIWRDPKDGLIHFKYISAIIKPTVHYKDYVDILKDYEPNTRVEKIINYLRYGYNYNYARTYFFDLPFREDVTSQTKYGATYREHQNFFFVRTKAVADGLAIRKLMRRKDPIVFDKFSLPIKAFNDNLGDVIEITHFEGKGANGYQRKAFQIRTTQDDLDNFTRKETLEDVSNFVGMAFILGPAGLGDWIAATPEQREKYGFLCNPDTGLMGDGMLGKRLGD